VVDSPTSVGIRFLRALHDPVVPSRIKLLKSLCAPEATWWVDTGRDRLTGVALPERGMRQGWPLHGTMFVDDKLNLFRSLVPETFPEGVSISIDPRTIESGSLAVVEAEGSGYAKNGKLYNNRYAFLFDVRNGLIWEIREYLDTLHAQDVFGDIHEGESKIMPKAQVAPPTPKNDMESLMTIAWESFSAGDIDEFAQCFSIDATWWTDSGLERERGRFQFMQTALDATPFHGLVPMSEKISYIREKIGQSYGGQSIEVSPIRFISRGNRVACEAVGYASLTNGCIYQNRYLLIAEVVEGKMTELREYCDTLHVADATGFRLRP
jgi:ketosteroid isomerase-like protein